MGTITQRTDKAGNVRYRAAIRINRKDLPAYSESKTFSKKSLATAWIKKREAEIEADPASLTKVDDISFGAACIQFLNETGDKFGRTRRSNIALMSRSILKDKMLTELTKLDYSRYAEHRLLTIKPQTLASDFVDMRAVLRHASVLWSIDVNLSEFENVVDGLRYVRKLAPSDKRTRLPTSDELQKLTTYFYKKYHARATATPYHLLIWLAIYTGRRQAEFTRMRLSDYHDGWWLIRDAKSPNGSKGNHVKVKIPEAAQKLIPLFLENRDVQRSMYKRFDDDILLPASSKSISARWAEACNVMGIEDLHFHDLRHEAATRLAEQGLSIPQIQQVTGHQSWSSLQIYVNMQPRKSLLDFEEAIETAKNSELLF